MPRRTAQRRVLRTANQQRLPLGKEAQRVGRDKIRSIDGPKPPPAPSLKQLRSPKATLLAAGQVVETVLRELGIWDTLILSMTSDMASGIKVKQYRLDTPQGRAAARKSVQRRLDLGKPVTH